MVDSPSPTLQDSSKEHSLNHYKLLYKVSQRKLLSLSETHAQAESSLRDQSLRIESLERTLKSLKCSLSKHELLLDEIVELLRYIQRSGVERAGRGGGVRKEG